MPHRVRAEAERTVEAPPQTVYAFLTDYRTRRPRILPPQFSGYAVEQGGEGAGTVVRFRLRAARRERAYRMQVEVPEAGRRIVERDANSSLVTTWTITPAGDNRSTVNLASEWQGGSGIRGFFERTFAPRGLGRIYADVLERLAHEVGPGGTD